MYEFSEFKGMNQHLAENRLFKSIDELLLHFDKLTEDDAIVENTCYVFGKICNTSTRKIQRKPALESTQFIVLVIDCTKTDAIEDTLNDFKHFHFIYHEIYEPELINKFCVHIIFPLQQPITPEEYVSKKVAYRLAKKLGLPDINEDFVDPARKHYLPFCANERNKITIIFNLGQECLSIEDILPKLPSVSPHNNP